MLAHNAALNGVEYDTRRLYEEDDADYQLWLNQVVQSVEGTRRQAAEKERKAYQVSRNN